MLALIFRFFKEKLICYASCHYDSEHLLCGFQKTGELWYLLIVMMIIAKI